MVVIATLVWSGSAIAQIGTPNVWNSTALPAGPHNVMEIEVDPLFPDTVYVSTIPGTIFRSFDQTATWTQVGGAIADDVLSMVLNPSNTAIIYAGTLGNGVYKSTDRAGTWAATTLAGMAIVTMDIDAVDPTVVYASSPDSVMKSSDSGATMGPGWARFNDYYGCESEPDATRYAFPGDGWRRRLPSEDGGATFIQSNTGLTNLRMAALALHPTRTDTLYAATLGGGVFRSYDRGGTWTAINNGLTQLTLSAIAVAPSNPTVLYAGSQSGQVFKSADNGTTWFDITLALADATTVGDIAVQRDSTNVVYAGILNVHRLRQTGLDSVSTLPTGSLPRAFVTADLDGNSELDLVVANGGGNTVSTFLTDAALASLSRSDLLTGSGPSDLAIGDVDGDGNQDLVVANLVKKTVTMAFGNGAGSFATPNDLFFGSPVAFVTVGDFDTDNDLDIAAAERVGGSVRVYLNDGLGSFGAPAVLATAPDLEAFTSGEFTGDGLLDLVVLSRSDASFVLLTNTGSAAFEATNTVAVGAAPIRLAAADFDIDGNLDVAVATSDDRIRIFRGLGGGAFDTPFSITLPDTVTDLVAADVDQDGYPDLVTPDPGGSITALINDGGGTFFVTPTTFGTVSAPGVVTVGDFSGDSAPDVVVARPGAGTAVLLLSAVAQNIKNPAPPRVLAANDSQGDLGDSVTLTWHRPNVDETTGRITRYRIFRAPDLAGPYAEVALLDTSASHTFSGVAVNRTYVDPNATLGEDFFYYLITENSLGTQSARSDTVTATSAAQAFFDLEFVGSSPFHVRDTIEVTVRLNPADQDIQSFSLFLDYDRRALTALDADATETGIQPFEVDSVLASQAQVLENVHDTTTSTGLIDYGLGFLPTLSAEPVPIGKLRFVSLRDTTTRVRFVNDAAANRETATTLRNDGSTETPFVLPATTLVLQNHRVWGRVAFQEDTEGLDLNVRFDLTQNVVVGTSLAVPYAPPNDLDLNANGVQTKLKPDGSFLLQQVPTGTYGLFVKAFHFLRGRVSTDSLVVNDSLGVAADVTFEWISFDSSNVTSSLRAGDANDDNRVNLTDFGVLAAHFGTSGFSQGSAPWGADFNDDGVVNISDFALLQSNFGEVGFGSAIPAKPALTRARLMLAKGSQVTGGAILALLDGDDVVGFALDVVEESGDGMMLDRSILTPSDWLRSVGEPMLLVRDLSTVDEQRLRVVVVFRGASDGLSGSGSLLQLSADAGSLRLENLQILYGDGSLASLGNAPQIPGDLKDLFPVHPQLRQNHPNPFNPETVIPFDVSQPARVTLRIYSPLGQEIRALLLQKEMAPGRHTIRWDGRDNAGREVGSGVFLYQISIGSFVDVRKAVLLR